MAYLDIDNLYKDQTILLFRTCYALEKIHGTSAHISYHPTTSLAGFGCEACGGNAYPSGELHFFSGGASHEQFVKLFDAEALHLAFASNFLERVTVFGEAYGGKMQGMKATYGDALRFVVFDVKVGDVWLNVPKAESVAQALGLDFVPYTVCSTDLDALDAARDMDSVQAVKNGTGPGHMREGVVLRPMEEFRKNNGGRVIAKHKRDDFRETKTVREVSPERLAVLTEAEAIADEWVTLMRLQHIIGSMPPDSVKIENMGQVIKLMVEDVVREGAGEIVDSKEARKAIGKKAASLFMQYLKRCGGME